MGFIAPVISAVAGIASIASTAKGLFGKKDKAPAPKAAPAAPTVEGAQKDATAEVNRRRRISLLSGGNTDVTRGAALVDPTSVTKKSLLGA